MTHHNNLNQVINRSRSYIFRFLLRLSLLILYKGCFHIAVSKGVANDIKNITQQKSIGIIPYGFDFKFLDRLKFLKKPIKIVSAGRFDQQKDFTNLINAFSYLNEKNKKNCSLTLIGDGQDYHRLLTHINNKNLNNTIKLVKWKNNVNKYFRKFDLFIFSSLYEGLPNVIIEAMSQGLPIISTDTPFGPSEILDNGKYGILVPMEDPEAMAGAMYKLLTNKKKYNYYAKQSLERAKYFSLGKMLKAYKKVILEALKIN